MNLLEKIDRDLKQALKAGDEERLAVLRLVKTGITNVEKQAGLPPAGAGEAQAGKTATDEDALAVIQREIKQRQDTISQLKSSRPELVAKDQTAIEILKAYLPAQLSAQEIEAIVTKAITDTQASGPQDVGKVMQQVMPKAQGRADGQMVSQIVRQKLS